MHRGSSGHQGWTRSSITYTEFLGRQLSVQHVDRVEALLPRRYLAVLRQAAQVAAARGCDVEIVDFYADAPGIGYQRGVLAGLLAQHQDRYPQRDSA